jgi:predicted acyltransferase
VGRLDHYRSRISSNSTSFHLIQFFLWIVGYSTGIAYNTIKPDDTPTTLFKIPMKTSTREHILRWYKIFKRTALLFFFGLVLSFVSKKFNFSKIEIPGVLQRISLCFFFISCLHILVENVYLQCFIVFLFHMMYLIPMFFFEVPPFRGKICGKGNISRDCRFE